MRKFGILTIAFFLLTGVLYAQEIPLALDEAVEIALRDNRDILFKAEDIKKVAVFLATQDPMGLTGESIDSETWENIYPSRDL